jgi:hypothetical protein
MLELVHGSSSSDFRPLLGYFLVVGDIVAEFSSHEHVVLLQYLPFLTVLMAKHFWWFLRSFRG